MPKLYGILWIQCTPVLQNKVQGDPNYDTDSDSFGCIWVREKLKFNSSGIAHNSKPFHAAFHAIKIVFNLRQGRAESMNSFYKHFDSALTDCKFFGCNTTSFPGLEKYYDDINDSGKRMAVMCLI